MLESFSKRAVELIETAKNLVQINNETNNEELVTTFYLLLSMYNANDTICHFLLNELEIEYNDLIEEYKKEEVIEQPSKVFTKEFEQLVIDASILSKEVGSEYVYDEHMFYTMLCNKTYSCTKILLNLHIDIEQLKQDIIDIFNFYKEEVLILDKEQATKPNYLINLSKEESLHKYIERKDYLNQLIYILSKRQKNNPLLIGQAGIGKTQLVSALSKKLNQDIYELDLGSLISGTKYRGEMEEKLVNAIKYVINQNAILFIDEVHNIVGAGSNDGSLDVANILKPYLSKGKLKLIAATTLDEYYKYIEKDKALTRRFQTIFIDEPSLEETKNILMGIKDVYEKHYQVYIEERLIDYIIELADNYILNKTFPDKAIDILDETLSRYKLLGINIYQLVKEVISSHEGVNIPSIKTAFILASSTNPREYIQRRGRVLRKFEGKKYSYIFDFVTLPVALSEVKDYVPAFIESFRALAKNEVERIKEFSSLAENEHESDEFINQIIEAFDLNRFNVVEEIEEIEWSDYDD